MANGLSERWLPPRLLPARCISRCRGGYVVNLLRIRAAVVNASVPRVEARDVGLWQLHVVRVEEFQKTVAPPVMLAHNVLTHDFRAINCLESSKTLL